MVIGKQVQQVGERARGGVPVDHDLGGARGPGEGSEAPWEPSWGEPGGAEPWWPGWGPPDAERVRFNVRGPRYSWTWTRTAAGDEVEQFVEEGAVLAFEVDRGDTRSAPDRDGARTQDGGGGRAQAVLQLVVDVVAVVVGVGEIVMKLAGLG
jgi:hypothetical protein